ncbi:hypothetical protein NDA15_003782 [Ustilago hordei]|nr:hypothetical protein NDA15_003782 [Ustilago hordei]
MTLKRSYDDALQGGSPLPGRDTLDTTCNDDSALSPTQPNTVAQGKQRRLSFLDDGGECASASTSSRPRALPSTSRARFVLGLQTFVGGLQMSQESSLASTSRTPTHPSTVPATRHAFNAPDAMQPLMMSRSAEAGRRASQSAAARRRSQEAPDVIARRNPLLAAEEAQLIPRVSPGWHVEAHGAQAMELHKGIRTEDEEGWTPLEAFPAATTQDQPSRSRRHRQNDLFTVGPPVSASITSSFDIEMMEDLLISPSACSRKLASDLASAYAAAAPHKCVSSSSWSTSSLPASSASSSKSSSTPVVTEPEEDIIASKIKPASPTKPLSSRDYSLSDFEVIDTLGTGTFGRVLLVRLKDRPATDRCAYFALKVLAKADVIMLKQVSHINSERSILTKVDHPFLVNMVASFQDSKNCYMLMEYVVGGEIFSYLRRAGHFSADVARFYISTIVLAIEYLHKNKVVYRDLKPENLLIDSNGYTKITDFGFAKEVEDRTWTLCGTPEYLAPEIIQCSGHGSAVDWWSLGILLYEMLAGYPPFYDPNPILIYEKILAGKLVFPERIDPVSRDLISSLLTSDRSRRLGNLRGGANDVKNHPWFYGVDWKALEEGKIPPPIVPYLGQPGDTSNFSKYEPARPSAMPDLFGTDAGNQCPYPELFSDF